MLKPMPAYFLVRVPRQEQSDRKNKIGSLFLHPNYVYMTRGMQCGQIIGIGSTAIEMLPEARVGQMLLFHHFVESNEKQQCVGQDPNFNYYVVTALSHNGQNNQSYGIFDGKEIIPHSDYLFLECVPKASSGLTLDERLEKNASGIFVFKEWRVDREGLREQMEEIKRQIDSLTKAGMRMTDQVAAVIRGKEEEMNRISKLLIQKSYQLYRLTAASRTWLDQVGEEFGCPIDKGDQVYMLNIACDTKMEFHDKEYIVAKSMHFGAPEKWVTEAMRKKEPHAAHEVLT